MVRCLRRATLVSRVRNGVCGSVMVWCLVCRD